MQIYTSPKLIETVAGDTSCTRQYVEVVAAGLDRSIAKFTDKKAVKTLIHSAIEFCAENYTSATNLNAELLKECTLTVLEYFSFLGVEEIKQSFRVAASGVVSVDLNTYYGKFNVNILTSVLNAYKEYRKEVASKLLQGLEVQKEQELKAYWKTPAGQLEIRHQIAKRVQQIQKYPESVRVRDYDHLLWLGVINLTSKDKKELMQEAEKLVNESQEARKREAMIGIEIDIITNEDFIKNKIIFTAKKIAVLRAIENILSSDILKY